jgi:hypothetical protein
MKSIILSIHSRHAEKIYSGEKWYELRKVVPLNVAPINVYFYETKPKGMITGYAIVPGIVKGIPSYIWENYNGYIGLTESEFIDYFKNSKIAYAIDVRQFKKYNVPLLLSDFFLNRAPQSWCYTDQTNL